MDNHHPFDDLTPEELEEMIEFCQRYFRSPSESGGEWMCENGHKLNITSHRTTYHECIICKGKVWVRRKWDWKEGDWFWSRGEREIYLVRNTATATSSWVPLPLAHQWLATRQLCGWKLESSDGDMWWCWKTNPHDPQEAIVHKNPHFACCKVVKERTEKA